MTSKEYMMNSAATTRTQPKEKQNITVFDFDFDDLENVGLQLLVYVDTDRVCAKEMVLFPRQSCVEHCHPAIGNVPGKEETFRCKWGRSHTTQALS